MMNNGESAIRRFLIMGCCSALLHVVIAVAIILPGMSSEKPAKIYQVEVRRLQPKTEQAEKIEPVVPEQPARKEPRAEPEKPAVVDLTGIAEIVSLETAERVEELINNADIVETPIPPVENAIITPDGGLGSGADTEAGGGNSLFASGTERGWGGTGDGEGWGGGSGSFGSGGGTGGGYGSGEGNSRGRAGGEETDVYYAGMPGIIPPGYDRAPQPAYPEASRARGEQGEVLLKVEVLANGRVGRTEVEKSSGHALLDDTALKTVSRWRFKPARKGRDNVVCWVSVPVKFRLN
jgi:TonB family protein